MKSTKKLVIAALLAAFTTVATMIIKFPTPTMGYIHLGDGFVLLCGIILGPVMGGLAAGIGSMFADLFSGYAVWAPATLVIKALTAMAAGLLFRKLHKKDNFTGEFIPRIMFSGLLGETVMVLGYYLYESIITGLSGSMKAGFIASASGIPFNILQGVTGIILAMLFLPICKKIPDVKDWIEEN